jgi:hypothetical protein
MDFDGLHGITHTTEFHGFRGNFGIPWHYIGNLAKGKGSANVALPRQV